MTDTPTNAPGNTGIVSVPRSPTPEMLKAGYNALKLFFPEVTGPIGQYRVYEAMIAAAPVAVPGGRDALDHLCNVLAFGAIIHPDDRNQAYENALAFYNAARPDFQVDADEHATWRVVPPGDGEGKNVQKGSTHKANIETEHQQSDLSLAGRLRRIVLDTLNMVAPAVENLAQHQEQCDFDGIMVKVSRQALDEVLNAVNEVAIQAAVAPRESLGEQNPSSRVEPSAEQTPDFDYIPKAPKKYLMCDKCCGLGRLPKFKDAVEQPSTASQQLDVSEP